MSSLERPDDFEARRTHLRELSDEELHARFWSLVDELVKPLIAEARTHTTPSIERSVLLRLGFSSMEAATLVEQMRRRSLLGHGAGGLVLKLAQRKGVTVREAGASLLAGYDWEALLS